MLRYFKCEFNTPLDFEGNLPTTKQDVWNFQEVVCGDLELYEFIENQTTEASFYLEKTFSYGDFFIIFALMVFTLFKIVEIIWNKFVERK